jgi:plastocyanin
MILIAGALASLTAVTVGQASAQSGQVVQIIGDQDLGAPSGQPFEFKQGRIVVHPQDTVVWRNETLAPHSITIIDQDEMPQTLQQLFACSVCEQVLMGHTPNMGPQGPFPPFVFAIDELKVTAASPARLDARGDSLVVAEQGAAYPSTLGGMIPDTISAVIDAPVGSTLSYVCALHPWMQGTIEVVR